MLGGMSIGDGWDKALAVVVGGVVDVLVRGGCVGVSDEVDCQLLSTMSWLGEWCC
jgi:hypothetical protein